MDEKENQKNIVHNGLNPLMCEHFKSLSKNTMMIKWEQTAGLHKTGTLPHPFVNFKIEVLNNCQKKRKSDDTATYYGYETPVKKVFSPNASSPDLGCVMDFSNLSPLATSKLSLLDSSQTVSSEIKGVLNSQQQSQQVKCGLSVDLANIKETLPHSLKSDEVPSYPAPDFDCDVDDILCLSPAGASTAVGFSENVESCKFPSGHPLKKKSANPSVAHRQKLEKGHWQVDKNQDEQNKETRKDKEEDKGYFSVSDIKDLEIGKNLSKSGCSQLPLVTSSAQLGVVKAPEDESKPESSTEQACLKQAKLSVKDISFTDGDFWPIVSGPQLGSINCPEELSEGDVEEVWNIGQPIFESSLCQKISVKLDSNDEQASEKLEGNVMEPIHECQATLGFEETTLESSYETTLSLVKVKSVVIAPSQPIFSSKPSSCSELKAYSSKLSQNRNEGFQPARFIRTARSPRPVFFKTKADLEREKRLYVRSVTGHMNERLPADPVTELRNLMTHVADQSTGPCTGQWQHPSDRTRRNYKKHCGKVAPNIPLAEWQAQNNATHRRFSKICKHF